MLLEVAYPYAGSVVLLPACCGPVRLRRAQGFNCLGGSAAGSVAKEGRDMEFKIQGFLPGLGRLCLRRPLSQAQEGRRMLSRTVVYEWWRLHNWQALEPYNRPA